MGHQRGQTVTGVEFLFAFISLLLGLAVAEVATGFADMWRGRETLAVGGATPLLGVYILLAAVQAWVALWGARDFLLMSPGELLRSVVIAMPYIFVARAMFPLQHDRWTSLEDYFERHCRLLLMVLIVPPAIICLSNLLRGLSLQAMDVLAYGVPILLPAVMMLWRRPVVHWLGLSVLSANALLLTFL